MANEVKRPGPPRDLVPRGRGRRFWKAVQSEYELSLPESELLIEACRALDLLDELRAVSKPLVVDGRANPALVEARQTRVELRRALGQMALPDAFDDESEGEQGLPPAVSSIRSQRARKAARARWSNGGV